MQTFLKELKISELNKGVSTGTKWISASGEKIKSFSPVDGKPIATINSCDKRSFDMVVQNAQNAFLEWRTWPAPKRGEVIRQIGNEM
jgi:aldehyde dehydrogenase (NAD+)